MSEFNSNKGLRIAKVIGTEDNIYVYDKDALCCKNCNDKCNVGSSVCCNSCNRILYHKTDGKGIYKNNKKNKKKNYAESESESEEECNNTEKNKFQNMRDIKLQGNFKFQVMPSNLPLSQPSLEYISGARGCGKSFWISNWLTQFRKLYKNYKVYLISRKPEDKAIDDLIDKRINADELVEADLKADDFKFQNGKGSCIIFDDVDTLPSDKKFNVKEAVYKLMEDVIEVGRSMGIFCLVTSHIPANSSESKRILNGCTSITLFTSCLNMNAIYLLEKHLGLTKSEIARIRKLESRWFTINKSVHPNIVISEKETYFIKNE